MREINSHFVLSKKNTLGIYRGCTNNCIFCPSRSRLSGLKDFNNTGIKKNSSLLLETALRHKRRKCMIHTDVISDPYQKLEKEKEFFRDCLKIIRDKEFGIDITTKNDLILRDLDLLEEINYNTKAVVQINFMTSDDELSLMLEPNAPKTSNRIKLVKTLLDHNIPVITLIRPILPFINDDPKDFSRLTDSLLELEPKGILCKGFGIRARKTTREFLFKNLEKKFNHLDEKYEKEFGESFIFESPRAKELDEIFDKKTKDLDLLTDYLEISRYLRKYENRHNGQQLNFFNYEN